MGHRIGVLGASGYAGGELVRLVDRHPDLELAYLGGFSSQGRRLGEVHPQLGGGDRLIGPIDAEAAGEVDLVFLSLPHGASAEPAVALRRKGVMVVDLGSDFRLTSATAYADAYDTDHPHPEELGGWVYGLPELFASSIAGSNQVAAPGCYPTSAVLALAPLLSAGLIDARIVVDAMSGVSGAGRGLEKSLMFGAVAEGVAAYGLLNHRHRPEMEQALKEASGTSPTVLFTPHLVPMQRGLLSTCYASATPGIDQADAVACLQETYTDAVFVDVIAEPPQTRWVIGSNRCLLSVRLDRRSGTLVVLSAIDNLMKGAAGQAIQCANLMLGLSEADGLPVDGWMP